MRPSGRSHILISGKRFFGDCTLRIFLLVAAAFLMPFRRARAVGGYGRVAGCAAGDGPAELASAHASSGNDTSAKPNAASEPGAPPAGSSGSAQPAQTSANPARRVPRSRRKTRRKPKSRSRSARNRSWRRKRNSALLGVVPMFNVQSNANAAPMTSKQKFQLFFKSSTDWYQFAITAIDGGPQPAGQRVSLLWRRRGGIREVLGRGVRRHLRRKPVGQRDSDFVVEGGSALLPDGSRQLLQAGWLFGGYDDVVQTR